MVLDSLLLTLPVRLRLTLRFLFRLAVTGLALALLFRPLFRTFLLRPLTRLSPLFLAFL